MYELNSAPGGISLKAAWRQASWLSLNANVWYLGATSLITDVSSEMITSILPIYLVLHLRMTPLAFGAIDGVYQGVAAVVRTGSGVISDRLRRPKAVAAFGYGLSALSKLGFLVAGARWPPLLAVVAGDRLGKGIRTAPRDTLIALSAAPGQLGTSFGVHRALDAAGATLGPIVAFAILALTPRRFDLVFLTSFWIAIVGLTVLVLFVQASPYGPDGERGSSGADSHGAAANLLRGRQFRPLLITASVLALATVSDAFLYLTLQQRSGFDSRLIPLLYVGTPLVYFMLAAPMGIVADRIGAGRTFLAGHTFLLVLYGLLVARSLGAVAPVVCVVLLGAYYAATDGVLAALASARLPVGLLGTGLAVIATATNLARVLASLAFGFAWTRWGHETALVLFTLGLCAALALAFRQLTPGHAEA
jgi:hypothetical protein